MMVLMMGITIIKLPRASTNQIDREVEIFRQ